VETDTNVDRLSLPRTSQKSRLEIGEPFTFSLEFSGSGEILILMCEPRLPLFHT